jgi:hypothetical protein
MDKMPIIAVIFQGIPESIVVYCFGMAIVGEYINYKKVLIASIITPFLMMFVRSVVPVFGIHLFISVLIVFFFFFFLIKLSLNKSILSAIASMSILLIIETLIYPRLFQIFNSSYIQAFNDIYQRILFPYIVIIIYAIITFIIYKFKFSLIKGKRVNVNE